MPAHFGKDAKGHYAQWGDQKKYYYDPKSKGSRASAKSRATRQGQAIKASMIKA